MRDFDLQPARDLNVPAGRRRGHVRREPGHLDAVVQAITTRCVRAWLHGYHRLGVTGLEHLPVEPPYVLVANHTSHLDTAALISVVPPRLRCRTYPLAAGDTFFESHASALLYTAFTNMLPLRRSRADRHAIGDLRERLLQNRPVFIVYPEGTRGGDESMRMFKPGIGLLVAGTPVPVVPCRLIGCGRALPKGSYWPRPAKVFVHIGRPMRFDEIPNERTGWQRVAQQLRAAVSALSGDNGSARARM